VTYFLGRVDILVTSDSFLQILIDTIHIIEFEAVWALFVPLLNLIEVAVMAYLHSLLDQHKYSNTYLILAVAWCEIDLFII
jgi:hypothetical protein